LERGEIGEKGGAGVHGFSENETMPNACLACAALVQSSPSHSNLSSLLLSLSLSLLAKSTTVPNLICYADLDKAGASAWLWPGLVWSNLACLCPWGVCKRRKCGKHIWHSFGLVVVFFFDCHQMCVVIFFFLLSTVWPELLLLLFIFVVI